MFPAINVFIIYWCLPIVNNEEIPQDTLFSDLMKKSPQLTNFPSIEMIFQSHWDLFEIELRFLILAINDQQQPLCKSIYEEPNINMLTENMTGEYCSNTTHQWMILTTYQEGIIIFLSW